MEIRDLLPKERDYWLQLRQHLWPDSPRDELQHETEQILTDPKRNYVFVAASASGELVGFVEVSIRDWAEGCTTHPVGYIEGWFVEPGHRRSGVGRILMEAAEQWALSWGCTEMGSDVELENDDSAATHRALGFTEVSRLVLFSKKLEQTATTRRKR